MERTLSDIMANELALSHPLPTFTLDTIEAEFDSFDDDCAVAHYMHLENEAA